MRNARLDLAKFCRAASGQNLAKSSRAFLKAKFLNYRGSIWPNFAGQLPGKIWPNRADEKCVARFGQILPGSLRAKFGQIELGGWGLGNPPHLEINELIELIELIESINSIN